MGSDGAILHYDNALFSDGFESGSTSAWSGVEPGMEMTVMLAGNVPLTLVRIPAGTFMMGSPASERGRRTNETLHEVRLTQSYWLGKYEVTQAVRAARRPREPLRVGTGLVRRGLPA